MDSPNVRIIRVCEVSPDLGTVALLYEQATDRFVVRHRGSRIDERDTSWDTYQEAETQYLLIRKHLQRILLDRQYIRNLDARLGNG